MYELLYRWGLSLSEDQTTHQWFIKVEAVDTEWYAEAYFSADDDPTRCYATNNKELLQVLIGIEETDVYAKCLEQKNNYMNDVASLENVDISNFM